MVQFLSVTGKNVGAMCQQDMRPSVRPVARCAPFFFRFLTYRLMDSDAI